VRIQIVDHERRSMFPLGSARLENFSSDIIKELAHIISSVPNRISISGHTDMKPVCRRQLHELGAVGRPRAPRAAPRRRVRAEIRSQAEA